MRKSIAMLLFAAIALNGYAVAAAPVPAGSAIKAKTTKKCLFPKSKKRAPAWVCDAHADGMAFAAVGSAAKSDAGLAFMEQMAAADARAQLAQNLHDERNHAASADSANQAALGRDNIQLKTIADKTLEGTKIMKRAYGPRGRLYVLIGVDENGAQKLREAGSSK